MREVVLRFAVRNYERARDLANQVAERAQRTLATTKATAGEVRESLDRAQKLAEVKERTAAGERFTAPGMGGSDRGLRFLAPVNQAREKAESLGRLVFGGREVSQAVPGLLTGVAPLLPGIGAAMVLIAPLAEKLFSYLDERLQKELDKRTSTLLARLDEQRLEADYARRLVEDPRFAREQARLALEQTLAEEARRGPRIERTRADLIADFGL